MKCIYITLLFASATASNELNAVRSLISERIQGDSSGSCFTYDAYNNKVAISCCRLGETPFHRKSEQNCAKRRNADAKYCPHGYHLERHTGEAEHGDVCRKDDRKDWVAPRWCIQTDGWKKPWTLQGCHGEVCRVPETQQCACSSSSFVSLGENYCRTKANTKGKYEGYYETHEHTDLAQCQTLCIEAGDKCKGVEHDLRSNKCEIWSVAPHKAKHGKTAGVECYVPEHPVYEAPKPEPKPVACQMRLCAAGSKLVGEDERGCGGECVLDGPVEEPCVMRYCSPGSRLVGTDERGCGGECVVETKEPPRYPTHADILDAAKDHVVDTAAGVLDDVKDFGSGLVDGAKDLGEDAADAAKDVADDVADVFSGF